MVQNEYLELLLEVGAIGLALFVALLLGLFKNTANSKYVWAVIAAFVVQWWFFSGYPNTLHMFLLLGFFYALAVHSKKKP